MGKRTLLIFTFLAVHFLASAQQPLPFPTANLQLWLRADGVELTDGKVSRWYDLSPNQYEIVQTNAAARPIVAENALNGHPALTFNGTTNHLTGGDILDLGTDSWTWFVIAQNVKSGWIFSKSKNGAYPSKYGHANTYFIYRNADNVSLRNTFALNTNASLYSCWENDIKSLSNTFYINGIENSIVSIQSTNMQSDYDFLVGAGEGAYCKGQIAEIIAFNTVDSALRCKVNEYLVNRYFSEHNIPVNLGLDIHSYSFADTTITTALKPYFTSYLWNTGETDSVIRVNKSGKYWVTVTNAFGYTSSDTINVYYPEPTQLTDTTICAGDVLTWNAALNGPYTYLWSDGSTESSLDITTAGK